MGLCVSYVLSALIKGQVDRALAYFEDKLGHGRVRVDGVVHLLKRHLVLNSDRHLRDQVAGLMAEDLAADDNMVILSGNDLDNAFGLADSDHLLVGRKAERTGDRLDPLGFRIGLSVADPCDLGFEEGGDGDNVVVYVIVIARYRLGNDQSLTLRLVGKLCAGGDIARSKDVGHAGAPYRGY